MSAAAGDVEKKGFRVSLDGAESKILRARGPDEDVVLLIVLDLTGDLAQIEAARQALIESIRGLPGNAWVAMLRAQDGVRVLADPSNDREKTIEAIAESVTTGKAGFLEAVETVSRVADSMLAKSAARVAVVYVTDSSVSGYREDFTNPVINSSDSRDLSRVFGEGLIVEKIRKVEASIAGAEAPLFFVHLEYRTDQLNEAYQGGLLQLAARTGGSGVFCRSLADIPGAVKKTIAAAREHWSLDIDLTKAKNRAVQVQVENGNRALVYPARIQVR